LSVYVLGVSSECKCSDRYHFDRIFLWLMDWLQLHFFYWQINIYQLNASRIWNELKYFRYGVSGLKTQFCDNVTQHYVYVTKTHTNSSNLNLFLVCHIGNQNFFSFDKPRLEWEVMWLSIIDSVCMNYS